MQTDGTEARGLVMLQYTTQNERELKHISFLRRIFLRKMTGKLHVKILGSEPFILSFHDGSFVGDLNECVLTLAKYLNSYVHKFAWEPCDVEATYGWHASWIVTTMALNDLSFEVVRLVVLRSAFAKLPPMVLKSCPIHRLNFKDEETYLLLYHLSLGGSSFKLDLFFFGDIKSQELTKRIRTMLLVFLLGYLRPIPKVEEAKKKSSIASRILRRFRAKGV